MKRHRALIALVLPGILALSASAASFDCGKAKRPLEKLICSNAELDAADTRLGEVYKRVNASFPLKGFLPTTQRLFRAGYPYCMTDDSGRPAATATAVRNCVATVQERIVELESLAMAHVYSDSEGMFSHENLAILTFTHQGKNMVRFWGNWMPDAYQPKPFPDGFLCDIEAELQPVKGGFKTEETLEAEFHITDNAVSISDFISCSARNGIANGEYRRAF